MYHEERSRSVLGGFAGNVMGSIARRVPSRDVRLGTSDLEFLTWNF
jgi:hypothetical protein